MCESCGKAFGSEQMLKRHKLIHGEFQFTCEYCDKKFPTKTRVRYHIEQ